ncbi:MAG TPA: helix-turn-helix transcriptional regulator [Candidatus Limadaptatus stercorigallinarum]|uniref:Helix-turn-helix transcriptional regulator n=1 Tax=Candidatus Limadaptatus stercorigallinarum TaxID=2840845 RepID=A0A9D1HSD9_9FIRM|nr:helix-turn-helix transcriptional regulator [Candidatus Limadaptatus stercorigallinarum]
MKGFGERLLELRRAVGLTQKQVADELGIHSVTYLHYEKDQREPPLDTVVRIAAFYDVTTDYLLGVEQSPSR